MSVNIGRLYNNRGYNKLTTLYHIL